MKLGLQTIRESNPTEAPASDRSSDNPTDSSGASQTDGGSESKAEERPLEKPGNESGDQSSGTRTSSEVQDKQTSKTEEPVESPNELDRTSSNREIESISEQSGDEPVPSTSEQVQQETSEDTVESESDGGFDSDFLRKETSLSGEKRISSEQKLPGKSTQGQATSVREDYRRYRAVETVRSSDTESLRIVLSDTVSGSGSGTTAVEVPSITVDREAPDRERIEEKVPASTPLSSRSLTVDREALEQPLPEVPGWLERTGQDVRVILRYNIGRQGNVNEVDVLGSSGYPELDDRSIDRLGNWQYEPGPPVRNAITIFEFRLE